ncbi:hypothetical protein C8R43DRAFT_1156872 [Mycena crocata]|nr:hypothetical protein C8R43DRAFT_1156872 [Mycena crocata]
MTEKSDRAVFRERDLDAKIPLARSRTITRSKMTKNCPKAVSTAPRLEGFGVSRNGRVGWRPFGREDEAGIGLKPVKWRETLVHKNKGTNLTPRTWVQTQTSAHVMHQARMGPQYRRLVPSMSINANLHESMFRVDAGEADRSRCRNEKRRQHDVQRSDSGSRWTDGEQGVFREDSGKIKSQFLSERLNGWPTAALIEYRKTKSKLYSRSGGSNPCGVRRIVGLDIVPKKGRFMFWIGKEVRAALEYKTCHPEMSV